MQMKLWTRMVAGLLVFTFLLCSPGTRSCPARVEGFVASIVHFICKQDKSVSPARAGMCHACPYAAAAAKHAAKPLGVKPGQQPLQKDCPIVMRGQFTDVMVLPEAPQLCGNDNGSVVYSAPAEAFDLYYSPHRLVRVLSPPRTYIGIPTVAILTGTVILRI